MGCRDTDSHVRNANRRAMLEAHALRNFVEQLPIAPPVEFDQELERLGYRGQDHQRSMLALMAYRHVRRLKRLHLDGMPRDMLPPKQNMLITGPTGCGKTYLTELLFGKILNVPTLITDATSLTENGYVGDDVKSLLGQLLLKSNKIVSIAQCGVICLDEFDKLAGSSSNARFAGAGTTKDVSGYGVQRELLTMIAGSQLTLPGDRGTPGIAIETHNIPFVACGAFSGLDCAKRQGGKTMGFHTASVSATGQDSLPDAAVFQRYGFIPELIGRFTSVLNFPPLNHGVLKTILARNILPCFRQEFRAEGIRLNVTDAALDHLARQAELRQTGARGLHTELIGILEQAAFSLFMQHRQATLNVTVKNNQLMSTVSNNRARRPTKLRAKRDFA